MPLMETAHFNLQTNYLRNEPFSDFLKTNQPYAAMSMSLAVQPISMQSTYFSAPTCLDIPLLEFLGSFKTVGCGVD